MKTFAILTTILAITLPFSSTFAKPTTAKTLATLENLENYQTSEGNQADLTKTKLGCALTLTMYGELGQVKQVYNFKGNKLLSAYKTEISYQNGGLYNTQNKTIKFNKPIKTALNVKRHQIFQDFNKLKAEFPKEKLALCY